MFTKHVTFYINYANIAWASTNKTKLFAKQKQAAHIIFNQDRFTHAHPLIKALNSLNIYQINLLQVRLFMLEIKTNSSPRIFLRPFQKINHKYATWYSRNNFKEPKTETNYVKYCIHVSVAVIWNSHGMKSVQIRSFFLVRIFLYSD